MVEFGGGVCLLLGIPVRPAATLIAIEMLVATAKVNWVRGIIGIAAGGRCRC